MDEEWFLRQYKDYYNTILDEKYHIYEKNFNKMLQAKKTGAPMKYLNWKNLFCIIKREMPRKILVGCIEDWKATSGVIYDNYKWVQTERGDYWCMSIWDDPVAKVYLDDTDEYEWFHGLTSDTTFRDFDEKAYQGDNTDIKQYYWEHCDIRKDKTLPYKKGEKIWI